MAAKKINKSAFVRGLPPTMPAPEVVKAAAAKGIKLSVKFVHTIRYNAKVSARRKAGGAATAKRGPGQASRRLASGSGSGVVAEIERIVEHKVDALLRERLGALFR